MQDEQSDGGPGFPGVSEQILDWTLSESAGATGTGMRWDSIPQTRSVTTKVARPTQPARMTGMMRDVHLVTARVLPGAIASAPSSRTRLWCCGSERLALRGPMVGGCESGQSAPWLAESKDLTVKVHLYIVKYTLWPILWSKCVGPHTPSPNSFRSWIFHEPWKIRSGPRPRESTTCTQCQVRINCPTYA